MPQYAGRETSSVPTYLRGALHGQEEVGNRPSRWTRKPVTNDINKSLAELFNWSTIELGADATQSSIQLPQSRN